MHSYQVNLDSTIKLATDKIWTSTPLLLQVTSIPILWLPVLLVASYTTFQVWLSLGHRQILISQILFSVRSQSSFVSPHSPRQVLPTVHFSLGCRENRVELILFNAGQMTSLT